jgi:hypothetical protein
MSQFDNVVFGKKKFSHLLEEIYNNQKKKDNQLVALINELKPLIAEIGDATLIVPLIKEYLEISVKNDDLLIKMAALAQRAMQTQTADGALTISDEEKEQLLAAMNELKGDK